LGAADTFKALGDPVRLRLFHILSLQDELCVCQLTETMQLPQSTVSRHLAILRHTGLVATRREGKWIHYRLAGAMAPALAAMVRSGADGVLQGDAERLASSSKTCD
jgi:ArsR family transcriptional regulator